MINLSHFEYLGAGVFSVNFSDGTQGTFDLRNYLSSRKGPLLLPLQEDECFINGAFIEAGALAWPNGLEIAPQRIYELTQNMQSAV